MSERQDSPSSGASRHLLPRAKAAIGFSPPRRSCQGVTDEMKSHDLMLLTAVCRHTALRGVSILGVGLHASCRRFEPLRHGFAVPPPLKWRQYAAVSKLQYRVAILVHGKQKRGQAKLFALIFIRQRK